MGSQQRRVFVIVGLSIAVHAAITVWALLGDPTVERPAWADGTRHVFIPDEIVADVTFDMTAAMPVPGPAPTHVTPAPAPAPPGPAHVVAPAHTGRPHHDPSRLAEPAPTAESLTAGLFSDDHTPLAHRRPIDDLAREADAARRHAHTAQIGDGDPRSRGDDTARTGTAPPCACDPTILTPAPAPPPPPEVPPPAIKVHPPRGPAPTTLSPDDVLRVITTKYMAGLERCQTQLLRRGADARGRVSLALTIDGSGATSAASADGVDPELDRCIEARATGWQFPVPRDPKSGDPTAARYELSLALQAH